MTCAMSNLKNSAFVFLLIVICQCTVVQYQLGGVKNNALSEDNCHAQCIILYDDTGASIFSEKKYYVFTGDVNAEQVEVEIETIVLKKAGTKWEKRKADKNCLSADPNDCMVWCLVETPEILKVVPILLDTMQSKNFEYRKIEYKFKREANEWREVICKKDVTKSLISQIQILLKEKGYYQGDITMKVDKNTISSLEHFQEDFDLPIGNLDYETLDVLGIVTPN